MQGSTRNWAKIVIAVSVVSVVGGGAGAYYIYDEYTKTEQETEAVRSEINQYILKRGKIPGLERDVIKLRENVSEYLKILPNDREVNEILEQTSEFATYSGVILDGITSKKDQRRDQKGFERVIYRINLIGSFDQLLTFANMFENHERFMNVTFWTIGAGDAESDLDASAGVIHNSVLEVETYCYIGEKSGALVDIKNYDRKKEELRDEIISARHNMPIEHYVLGENPLRRDIFVDPRIAPAEGEGMGLPLEEQKSFLNWTKTTIEEVRTLAELHKGTENFLRRLEIEAQIQDRVAALNERVALAVAESWITDATVRRRLEREIVPETQRLVREFGHAQLTPTITADELRRIRDAMEGDFDSGLFRKCSDRFEMARTRIPAADGLDERSVQYFSDMEKLNSAATTALDFEGIKLAITGFIIKDDGSVIIINGEVFQEGEAVDTELEIHKIMSDRVEFRFRGVVLSRVL